MFAIAVPFLLSHYLPLFFDRKSPGGATTGSERFGWIPFRFKRPQLRKAEMVFVAIVGSFVALMFLLNIAVTGKLFKTPLKYYQSWERLGFKRGHYTPVDGFFYLIARVFYLMDWFAPAFVAAYLFLLSKIKGMDRIKAFFRFSMVFLALAYFLYYSWGGNQWGPRYWWEGLPFLCISVADWIVTRWKTCSVRGRKFLFVFVATSIASSGLLFIKHAEFTGEASRQRRALYDLAERTVEQPAIVFIHGFLGDKLVMAEEDAVRNSPFLDGRILYAHDLGDRNRELMAAYPGRTFYRGTYDRKLGQPGLEKI